MEQRTKNLVGFWILGLCNNYSYVIMLSAAHDLLHNEDQGNNSTNVTLLKDELGNERDCNEMSTGAILLADVVPAILVKMTAPFIVVCINTKVWIVTILSGFSFILVSISHVYSLTIIGVVCASIGSGLGEASFLSYSHFFKENVISTWSSGTGAAGVVGAGSYALLTTLGLHPRTTVILMICVPVFLASAFFFLVSPSGFNTSSCEYTPVPNEEDDTEEGQSALISDSVLNVNLTVTDKIYLVRGLLRFMLPLGAVYYFEYLINQGLFELLYFPKSFLDHQQQYRWYQLIYQIGVLISRSSLGCLIINRIYLLSFFQGVNLLLLSLQSVNWTLSGSLGLILIFIFVFWEGLLGGAAYVNTFHKISQETEVHHREFSLGIASLADSMAIGLAGLSALPIHNLICKIPL